MKKVIISQIKSKIGVSPAQRDTLRSLGLKKNWIKGGKRFVTTNTRYDSKS